MRNSKHQATRPHRLSAAIAVSALVFASAWLLLTQAALADDNPPDAFAAGRLLGRGVNLGNALEAPREGEWGFTLKAEYFRFIKQAGFDSVRIPVRWSAYAEKNSPYQIQEKFFRRVDWAVDEAIKHDLAVVVNVHHFEELYASPATQWPRFLAIWRQVAQRYRDRPASVCFEILNEPHGELDADRWNSLLREALVVIRQSNPRRAVIVGPAMWNNISQLPNLELPEEDRRLIVTVHYYLPFEFTHQGASWVDGSDQWLGRSWQGNQKERQEVRDDLASAADWARRHGRPLFLGEFGAYSKADFASRVRWTRHVREQAERLGMSWAYWEFGSGFGVYDPETGKWHTKLLQALCPD